MVIGRPYCSSTNEYGLDLSYLRIRMTDSVFLHLKKMFFQLINMSLFLLQQNKGVNSITSTNSTVIEELYYLSGEIIDTVTLGESLKQFFEGFGFPLYQETKIPQGAEVLKIVKSSGNIKKKKGSMNCFN